MHVVGKPVQKDDGRAVRRARFLVCDVENAGDGVLQHVALPCSLRTFRWIRRVRCWRRNTSARCPLALPADTVLVRDVRDAGDAAPGESIRQTFGEHPTRSATSA